MREVVLYMIIFINKLGTYRCLKEIVQEIQKEIKLLILETEL